MSSPHGDDIGSWIPSKAQQLQAVMKLTNNAKNAWFYSYRRLVLVDHEIGLESTDLSKTPAIIHDSGTTLYWTQLNKSDARLFYDLARKHLGGDNSPPSLSSAILNALETLYPGWVEAWEMENDSKRTFRCNPDEQRHRLPAVDLT